MCCRNSEIYNQDEVRESMLGNADLGTTSDSAIVGHMYAKLGDCNELWNRLDGIFACVIVDRRTGHFCAARDPMGICSFYWGKGHDGSIWFASELKCLQDNCETFEFFPPVRAVSPALNTFRPTRQQLLQLCTGQTRGISG